MRQSLTILTEIHLGAVELQDMQGELPTEITQTCLHMRKNMAKLVQAKSLFAQQQEAQGDPSGLGVECME